MLDTQGLVLPLSNFSISGLIIWSLIFLFMALHVLVNFGLHLQCYFAGKVPNDVLFLFDIEKNCLQFFCFLYIFKIGA